MVYWSGRGGSVLVGLLSVVGRFPEICHQLNPFIVFVALLFRSPDRSIGSTGLGIIYLSFFLCIKDWIHGFPFTLLHCVPAKIIIEETDDRRDRPKAFEGRSSTLVIFR